MVGRKGTTFPSLPTNKQLLKKKSCLRRKHLQTCTGLLPRVISNNYQYSTNAGFSNSTPTLGVQKLNYYIITLLESSQMEAPLTPTLKAVELPTATAVCSEVAGSSLEPPLTRSFHTVDTIADCAYVLGGHSSLAVNDQHYLQLSSGLWRKWKVPAYALGRHGHASATLSGSIYWFGGCMEESIPTNDFFSYSPRTVKWTRIEEIDESKWPTRREMAILQPINQQYLLLYGGIDKSQQIIFSDAYVYLNEQWEKWKVQGEFKECVGSATAVRHQVVWGFGGRKATTQAFSSELFRMVVREDFKSVAFQIVPVLGKAPCARAGHSMEFIRQDLLIVYGGVGLINNKEGILGDLWLLDTSLGAWVQIEAKNQSLPARAHMAVCIKGLDIWIFGGVNSSEEDCGETFRISLAYPFEQEPWLCKNCSTEQVSSKQEVEISPCFYHNIGLDLTFPFMAVSLIIHSAELLCSQSLSIHTFKNKHEIQGLIFTFQPAPSLPHHVFPNFSEKPEDPAWMSQGLYGLKVGGLRLGKTILLISNIGKWLRLSLVSCCDRFNPHPEQQYRPWCYIYNLETGENLAKGIDKEVVLRMLESQFALPISEVCRPGTRMLILHTNIWPTAEKTFYYELILGGREEHDFRWHNRELKIDFLDTLGYSLANYPDFSLVSYLQLSVQRQRQITVRVADQQEGEILTMDYRQHLEDLCKQGELSALELSIPPPKCISRCQLYQPETSKPIPNNQGILIYCQNHLMERLDCPLGELFNHFFCTPGQRSKPIHLFKVLGIVQLGNKMTINRTLSRVRQRSQYNEVIKYIRRQAERFWQRDTNELNNHLHRLHDTRFAKEPHKKAKLTVETAKSD